MALLHVTFEPVGRRIDVPAGVTVLEATQAAGVELVATCGGMGLCDTCRVRVIAGTLSPLTAEEEEAFSSDERMEGLRLACQAVLRSDARLAIPPTSLAAPQRLQLEGTELAYVIDPAVTALDTHLPAPTIEDVRADGTRLVDAATTEGRPALSLPLHVLADASDRLRAQEWTARLAIRHDPSGDALVAVLPPGERLLGLAFDLGTTKLAGYLVDLETGETLAREGAANPQIAYGEDVVSRIAFANRDSNHRTLLQTRLAETLDALTGALCAAASADRTRIVEAVAVGNTAMHHLLLGLPVRPLGEAPYVPATVDPASVPAREVGLHLAPGADVVLPPNVAGYVGSDHVAMLLAAGVWDTPQTVVALDIGTNTEITVAGGGQLLCCSAASGPAFEGAHIRDGMRAVPGAIERVQLIDGVVHWHTIGNRPPVGLCGSGLLDAVATLRTAGRLDARGSFRDGTQAYVLAPAAVTGHGRDVVLTRADVHEIQLAKGAIRAAVDLLLAEAGLAPADVDAFVVAGAFGTYLSLESALCIGLFPPVPRERFRQVGNAAGMGARQLLLSAPHRRTAAALARRIRYVELTNHAGFTDAFMDALFL